MATVKELKEKAKGGLLGKQNRTIIIMILTELLFIIAGSLIIAYLYLFYLFMLLVGGIKKSGVGQAPLRIRYQLTATM